MRGPCDPDQTIAGPPRGIVTRLGPVLALIGAALAIAGVFLPWARVTVVRNPVVGSALVFHPSGWSADGLLVVIFGAIAAAIGLVLLWRDTGLWGSVLRTLVLLCGLVVVGTTFWDVTHARTRFSGVRRSVAQEFSITRVAPRVHVRLSPWIVVSAGGGALLIVAAVIDRFIESEEVVVEDDGTPASPPSAAR
jgi:hypothetical protein